MDENSNIAMPVKELERKMKKLMVQLPQKVGAEVVNFALDNFKRQAWLGDRIEPWKRRKSPTKWGTKPKRNGRAILVDAGHLRRSIRFMASWDQVRVFSSVPYAKVHNDGFRGSVHQAVSSFTRKQTYAGVASKFKVNGVEVVTGLAVNIKTMRKKVHKVQANTFVTGFNRKIKQNIPRRRFLGDSQYLRARLRRLVTAESYKVFPFLKTQQ